MTNKRLLALLTAILLVLHPGVAQTKYCATDAKRPKVAVVLSGGGAKGSAHVGALKMIEQMGIPVDMVVGTSMGALIGGLYSIGFGAQQIDSLLKIQDWDMLLLDRADPLQQNLTERRRNSRYFFSASLENWHSFRWDSQGLVKGTNIDNLFAQLTKEYHDSISFDSLPIPYAAVATDLVRDSQVVMRQGRLATAMRASMSIPLVFSPVLYKGMLLADGGLKDNFPVDVARQMGADIVIGISVQNDEPRHVEDFRSTMSVIGAIVDGMTVAKTDENAKLCDVHIKVDVKGFSTMSFSRNAIDTLIARGYSAAQQHIDKLAEIRHLLGDAKPQHPHYDALKNNDKIYISQLKTHGMYSYDSIHLAKHLLKESKDSISISKIENLVGMLRERLLYNNPSYLLSRLPDSSYSLSLNTEGKKAAQLFFGVRYDNLDRVAMQISSIIPLPWEKVPIILQPTLRLGEKQEIMIATSISPFTTGMLSLSYLFQHNRLDVYEEGLRSYNIDYALHEADFGIKEYGFKNLLLDLFCRWDWISESTVLSSSNENLNHMAGTHLFSYYGRLHYNNQNHNFLATQGTDFVAEYSLHTDNFHHYQGAAPISIASVRLQKAFPLNLNLSFEPLLYGRAIFDDKVPALLSNYIGGPFFGHSINQQLPFAGTLHLEFVGRYFLASEAELRYHILKDHYVLFTLALGNAANEIENLFTGFPMIGCRMAYVYTSVIGPLSTGLGFSNISNGLNLFINIGHTF
ncbi:MAG: patatin-like phospholipase family protein [Bacteroidales bacterium]|nr:patatin-like phospholipase family protein [Bacteroidales bacterium]